MQNTPVSDLLKSTTTEVLEKYNEANLENDFKEFKEELKSDLEDQLYKMEGLIQSLIINQQSLAHGIKNQIAPSKEVQESKKEKRPLDLYQSALIGLIAALALSLGMILTKTQAPKEEVVANQEIIKNTLKNETQKKYFLIKYINLRSDSSTKADVITVLPKNAIIEVLAKDSNWTHVSYKDHVENKIYKGWIWGDNYKEVFSEARLKN